MINGFKLLIGNLTQRDYSGNVGTIGLLKNWVVRLDASASG